LKIERATHFLGFTLQELLIEFGKCDVAGKRTLRKWHVVLLAAICVAFWRSGLALCR
jgi:hypothetical protein